MIPVAHWGTLDIVPYREKMPRLFPRKTVHVMAGRPVDLSQWAGQQHSAKALHTSTDAIMAQVTELVGQLRGETPPPVPYDPRNPHRETALSVSRCLNSPADRGPGPVCCSSAASMAWSMCSSS